MSSMHFDMVAIKIFVHNYLFITMFVYNRNELSLKPIKMELQFANYNT